MFLYIFLQNEKIKASTRRLHSNHLTLDPWSWLPQAHWPGVAGVSGSA